MELENFVLKYYQETGIWLPDEQVLDAEVIEANNVTEV